MKNLDNPNATKVTLEDLETGLTKYTEKSILLTNLAAIRDVAKKARKTSGAIQAEAAGKLTGVEAFTVMKRDAMRNSLEPGMIRIAPNQTLKTATKANRVEIMMIQEEGIATHPMKNARIKNVTYLGSLLKDPSVYQAQETIILKRKKQEEIGAKILHS